MGYEIRFSRLVREQLRRLPGHIKTVARNQIASLSENPAPPESKELSGHPGYRRLWIGSSHPLVWQVLDEERAVEIHYIGPKYPDLYEFLSLKRPK